MLPPDDRSLLELASRGDITAFEALIRPHVPAIRRLAYAFCRNWADADDLAQDALLKSYRSLKSFRGDSSLSTWLYTVARSTFLDWRKGKAERKRLLEDAYEDEGEANEDERQDALVEGKAEVEALWNAIRQLDPRFRVPLVLYDIEGMSYEEIAVIEEVPVGTVRSRLSRARHQLSELLTGTTSEETSSDLPGRTSSCPS